MNEPSTKLDPDKEKLWGWWYTAKKWQGDLHKSASYKALDIPEDMGDINAPKTLTSYNGMTWRELAIIGALVGGGVYAASRYGGQQAQAPVAPAPVVAPVTQPVVPKTGDPLEDRDYVIHFYDKDGKEIIVDRKDTQ